MPGSQTLSLEEQLAHWKERALRAEERAERAEAANRELVLRVESLGFQLMASERALERANAMIDELHTRLKKLEDEHAKCQK